MKKVKLLAYFFVYLSVSNISIAQDSLSLKWHKMYNNTLQGVRSEDALHFLKAKKLSPRKQIIVGIIDSGIDTTVVDLQSALWTNRKEKRDGKDNDKNGYADDIHGWNFLGTKDGTFNMTSAGTEEYREFKRLFPKYKDMDSASVKDVGEYAYYEMMKKKAGIMNYIKFFGYTAMKDDAYQLVDSVLQVTPGISVDTLTINGLAHLPIDNEKWNKACETLFVDMYKGGKDALWKKIRDTHRSQFNLMKKRIDGIEHDTDKRLLMGDDMTDPKDRFYGNATLQVEGCEHGTFVAGVIAGQGVGDVSVTGIYPEAKLMILRAVPDGDEYDKDIATAIRYAVDNGAKVINMSLGKYTSPNAEMVNEAIAYAAKKDVLLVQAAGNNKKDIDDIAYFPSAKDKSGAIFSNYLRVGASDKQGKMCSFSNYGRKEVDVFAPGEDITSVTAGNEYMKSQGTSVAAPVVTAVAAMLRAYFPKLKAAQVKDILIKSVRPMQEEGLCTSGGIVDALQAVKLAMEYKK
ncbi:S8 family serine peptidase [Bacteroides bouchesdurhonensis]|uniref:S8 family serine peptidase n=1 Tax=Bacteroides bouchesdurhonensis TaxID=1841855 RepID=UPI00097F8433|nr:S8 family serine peptidase [Bacteroides bouchesdurhonensis]